MKEKDRESEREIKKRLPKELKEKDRESEREIKKRLL